MAELLSGAPVAEALCERVRAGVARLARAGVTPKAAIVRVGERPADLSYERGFVRRAQGLGIQVERLLLPESAEEKELLELREKYQRRAAERYPIAPQLSYGNGDGMPERPDGAFLI